MATTKKIRAVEHPNPRFGDELFEGRKRVALNVTKEYTSRIVTAYNYHDRQQEVITSLLSFIHREVRRADRSDEFEVKVREARALLDKLETE